MSNLLIDEYKIISALKAIFQPGDVFEVRALDAITKAYNRPHIESGYFEYEHIDKVPSCLTHIIKAKGIYFTVNPVKKDLLARAVNRVRAPGREPTTADSDILCRRWLLIDCDAKRVSGVSSTDEEHSFALSIAQEIKAGLGSIDWPMPIEIDSGNGAQLMYRVDLPTDDNGLLQKVIQSIASVSTDKVDIDLTVHNPARIWRLPGTWNCKGDSTPERPYRMSTIINLPPVLLPVSKEQLESTAQKVDVTNVPSAINQPLKDLTSNSTFYENQFNLEDWIAKHLPNLDKPKYWNGGRKWVFDICPFNDSHTDKSAVLIEQNNGAIAFTCHHNSCQGNDWHKLREMLEPGCYDKKTIEYPKIDLTNFLESFKEKKKNRENPFAHPGEVPEHLYNVPGLVGEILDLSLKTAPYPSKVVSLCAAISFVAHLAGRKFRDKRNNFTNLYMIALAPSGSGKDHPRKVNIELANQVGIGATIGDSFASGAGLEDFMYLSPNSLFQVDEIDCLFNVVKGAGRSDNTLAESINEKLLKFYSESNSTYFMRKKALQTGNNEVTPTQGLIHYPSLNIMGTAVPDYFYESMSKRVLENGLIARCMVFEAGLRSRRGKSLPVDKHVTTELRNALKELSNTQVPVDFLGKPTSFYDIPDTEEATELIDQLCDECDEKYFYFHKLRENSAMALTARLMEKVYKLAMVYAISVNHINPIITVEAVRWAYDFANYATNLLLHRAGQFCYENTNDKHMKKILKMLQEADGEPVPKRDIMRKIKVTTKELDILTESLISAEKIAKTYYDGKVCFQSLD